MYMYIQAMMHLLSFPLGAHLLVASSLVMVVDFEEGLADRIIDRDAFPDDEVVVEGEG